MNELIAQVNKLWYPPAKLSLAQWSETYYELPEKVAQISGKYSLQITPYLRGIMDALDDASIREVDVKKSCQVGMSTLIIIWLAYIIAMAGGPTLLIEPRDTDCKLVIDEQLRQLQSQPACKPYITDITHDGITATTSDIYLGASTSPQDMQRRFIRNGIGDETDNFETATKVADPVNMIRSRTITAGNHAKNLFTSTPTTSEGTIAKLFEAAPDKRFFMVPCPYCNKKLRLTFKGLHWKEWLPDDIKELPHNEQADYVRKNQIAKYECEYCHNFIDDSQRWNMISKGEWEGTIKASVVAFHISAFYSYFVSFSRMAAEWLIRCDSIGGKRDFYMQWLGEEWHDIEDKLKVSQLKINTEAANKPKMLVPADCQKLTVQVDTQDNGFPFIVTAWSRDKCYVIYAGQEPTTEALLNNVINRYYQIEGYQFVNIRPALCLIDSGGHRKDEIYAFTKLDKPRIIPIKGMSWSDKKLFKDGQESKLQGVNLKLVNTILSKDTLKELIDAGKWIVYKDIPEDYFQHLQAEVKEKDTDGKYRWKNIHRMPNHYLDCSGYAIPASEMINVQNIPDEARLRVQYDAMEEEGKKRQAPISATATRRVQIDTSYLRGR